MNTIIKEFDGKILAHSESTILFYSRGKLWFDNHGARQIIKFPKSFFSNMRICERLFRLEPRLGFTLNGTFYFTCKGVLYRVDGINSEAIGVFRFRQGMNNPLSICKVLINGIERVLFGDYWTNPNHERACVYSFDGFVVHVLASIDGVKHIHGISYDKYRKCFYILTGDSDEESAIFYADEEFQRVNYLWKGSQKYRTCALVPLKSGILYASDSPLERNYIYYSRIVDDCFQSPEAIFEMPGPCVYSYCFDNSILFATSVESNPNQKTLCYWFSQKKCPGNVDSNSYIIKCSSDLKVISIAKIQKDSMCYALFGFGNIQIVGGEGNTCLAYCSALKKYDGKTILINSSED